MTTEAAIHGQASALGSATNGAATIPMMLPAPMTMPNETRRSRSLLTMAFQLACSSADTSIAPMTTGSRTTSRYVLGLVSGAASSREIGAGVDLVERQGHIYRAQSDGSGVALGDDPLGARAPPGLDRAAAGRDEQDLLDAGDDAVVRHL